VRRLPGAAKAVVVVVLIGLLTAGSLSVYFAERHQGQTATVVGDTTSADRVDIIVGVQKLDSSAGELSTQLIIVPQGALADDAQNPKQDLTVATNGLKADSLVFKAGQQPSLVNVNFLLTDGVVTDYPFDVYRASLGFYVTDSHGNVVPSTVVFGNSDSFFRFASEHVQHQDHLVNLDIRAARSLGTLSFAVFIMLLMWLMSLIAILSAWFVITGRHGLLWPSMSFLGVVLFALVPLRNVIPGSPPIGSILDFGAFFMAEAFISLSLIATVITGYRVERARRRDEAAT
jgi:hypothetical protein